MTITTQSKIDSKQKLNQNKPNNSATASAIKAVIFDYDGVLVDSVEIGLKSYQEIGKHFGIKTPSTLEEFRKSQTIEYKKLWRSWGADTEEKLTIASAMYKKMHTDEKPKLISGVKEILNQLSAKYKLAVVSGTYRDIIEKNLKEHKIDHYFSYVITSDDVKNIKPAPDGMLLCLQKLNIAPSEAFFIGDMAIDIQMGRAAGVKTAIIPSYSWNTKTDILKHSPDMIIESHEYITKVLQ